MSKNILLNEDYIKFLTTLSKNSVDFICIDPPYGKISGMQLSGQDKPIDWDVKINWSEMFKIFNRVLKPGGTICVFGQNPTYSEMISANINDYKYEYVWKKNNAAQGFHANKMPLIYTENIAVFVKEGNTRVFNKPNIAKEINKDEHFSRWYAQKLFNYINKPRRQIHRELGHRKLEFYFMYNGKQFGLCSEELYKILIEVYKINEAPFFEDFNFLKQKWISEKIREKNTSLDASVYVGSFSNLLDYAKDYKPYLHPTQKPIALMELLVSIYTNEGDIVLDCFAGSGSTLLAAKNLNRFYYGCELDKGYFEVSKKRLG
jgi:site-specific DNA-methyltransferase (adenine-specific)